jgi:hypothetical protein
MCEVMDITVTGIAITDKKQINLYFEGAVTILKKIRVFRKTGPASTA